MVAFVVGCLCGYGFEFVGWLVMLVFVVGKICYILLLLLLLVVVFVKFDLFRVAC